MKPGKQTKVATKARQGSNGDKPLTAVASESELKDDKTLGHDDGAVKPAPVPLPIGEDADPFPPRPADPIPRRDPHRR